jgi:opacity protein-like surface antigen
MKKILLSLLVALSVCQIINSQTFDPQGKAITEIFTDFHLNLNDTSKTSGFGLNRAYLGYNFTPDKHFSGTIIVNAGKPDDLAPGSEPRRYSYFREASISYSNDKLKLSLGITGTRLFDFQQKFWGKRYIANTYQSLNGYGFVADLGLAVDYRFSDILKADVTIMNGEGYSNVQLDNSIKTSLGLNITPSKEVAIRIYSDIMRLNGVWQQTFIGFIGFKNELLTIGAEATYKSNLDAVAGHHAWGISGTGALCVAKNTEVFIRYDYSTSTFPAGDILPWNYQKDGVFLVTGLQYSFTQNIKLALNYQGTHPYDSAGSVSDAVFLNALFRF